MPVTYESTINRFIGLSTDTKPTHTLWVAGTIPYDVPIGSTFWEYDTKIMYKTYDGINWSTYDTTAVLAQFLVGTYLSSAATTTTITSAALVDVAGKYVGQMVIPIEGDMAGEGRYITAYNGTNQLTVSPAWAADPDAGGAIYFQILSSNTMIVTTALGTDGTTVTDSATTVLGAVGANNADNAFTSNLVAGNADGSTLEREEYIQSELAKVPKSDAAVTWNATALAALTTQDALALTNILLNKLMALADGTGKYPASVIEDSALAKILSKADPAVTTSFDNTTDSLEALADAIIAAKAVVDAISAYVDTLETNMGDMSGDTLKSVKTKMGDIARSFDVILGARWDSSGDLGTDIALLLTYCDILDDATNGLAAIRTLIVTLTAYVDTEITEIQVTQNSESPLITTYNTTATIKDTLIGTTAVKLFVLDALGGTKKDIRCGFFLDDDVAATFTFSVFKTRPGDLLTSIQDSTKTWSIVNPAADGWYTYDVGDLESGLQMELRIAQNNAGDATNVCDAVLTCLG